jgi:excisionase family DNA binding protein
MQTAMPILMTKKELATLVKTSIPSINRWMKSGKIPYLKVGKKVLFDREKVIEHLQSKFTVINDSLPAGREQDVAINSNGR